MISSIRNDNLGPLVYLDGGDDCVVLYVPRVDGPDVQPYVVWLPEEDELPPDDIMAVRTVNTDEVHPAALIQGY